jgi:hypothetical protein
LASDQDYSDPPEIVDTDDHSQRSSEAGLNPEVLRCFRNIKSQREDRSPERKQESQHSNQENVSNELPALFAVAPSSFPIDSHDDNSKIAPEASDSQATDMGGHQSALVPTNADDSLFPAVAIKDRVPVSKKEEDIPAAEVSTELKNIKKSTKGGEHTHPEVRPRETLAKPKETTEVESPRVVPYSSSNLFAQPESDNNRENEIDYFKPL